MQAYRILQRLRANGLEFGIRGGQLAVRPGKRITDEIRNAIKSHRDELVKLVDDERRVPCLHDVLERAAILEYAGHFIRAEADRLALAEFGFGSWEALTLAQNAARRDRP